MCVNQRPGSGGPHQVHVINPDSAFSLYHQVEPNEIRLLPWLQEKRSRDSHPAHGSRDGTIQPAGEELSLARNAYPHFQKGLSIQVLRLQFGHVDQARIFDADVGDLKQWHRYRILGLDTQVTFSVLRDLRVEAGPGSRTYPFHAVQGEVFQ